MPNDNDVSLETRKETAHPQNTAGILVLQWLTYAFWGWLIIGLIWLAWLVFQNAIVKSTVAEILPYAIAASLVLLPLAFVTDLFYRKHEPLKKSGGSGVIMIIHTVIFALLGIISLIVAVFTGINLAIEPGDTNNGLVILFTALTATALYAATFIRTLNPFKSKKPLALYSFAFLGITLLLLTFAIVGPLMRNIATRSDRLIEQNLSAVNAGVNRYVEENNTLPASLKDITVRKDEARQLINDGLVTYTQDQKTTQLNTSGVPITDHRYQLCVEYKEAKGSDYYDDTYREYDEDGDTYSNYISTYSHEAGKVCYKLKTTTRGEATSGINLQKLQITQ